MFGYITFMRTLAVEKDRMSNGTKEIGDNLALIKACEMKIDIEKISSSENGWMEDVVLKHLKDVDSKWWEYMDLHKVIGIKGMLSTSYFIHSNDPRDVGERRRIFDEAIHPYISACVSEPMRNTETFEKICHVAKYLAMKAASHSSDQQQ